MVELPPTPPLPAATEYLDHFLVLSFSRQRAIGFTWLLQPIPVSEIIVYYSKIIENNIFSDVNIGINLFINIIQTLDSEYLNHPSNNPNKT